MAGKKAKTTANDDKEAVIRKRRRICPTCGEETKPIMLLPGRTMKFFCINDHYHRKGECRFVLV